jgi:hypothetical protein
MRSPSRGARMRANRKLNRTLTWGVVDRGTWSLFGKNNKGFKGQKCEQCYLKYIMQLCSCRQRIKRKGVSDIYCFLGIRVEDAIC